DGDVDAVRTAVTDSPRLLGVTVERDGQGRGTPLHLAVADGRADVVRVLVEAGADLTARTEVNRTPLHVALQFHPELVPPLRDLDTRRVPLHAAVAAGTDGDAPEIVKALLKAGADATATTNDGASPLDMSRIAAARHRRNDADKASAHDAVAELLVAHGGTE